MVKAGFLIRVVMCDGVGVNQKADWVFCSLNGIYLKSFLLLHFLLLLLSTKHCWLREITDGLECMVQGPGIKRYS